MRTDSKAVAAECTHGSDAGTLSFGEVVGKLVAAGFERYHTDLVRGTKTYYLPDGDNETLPGAPLQTVPTSQFAPNGVDTAIKSIQAGEIDYLEFCRRIAAAGCVGYIVSLSGRRAVYYGRNGDLHVERFPGEKQTQAA